MSQISYFAGIRHEILKSIFSVNSRFHCMSMYFNLILCQWKFFAICDSKLPFHKILLSNHFSDTMLNLQPAIHLHKVILICLRIENKFYRSSSDIVDSFCCANRCLTKFFTNFPSQMRCRGFFNNFLVSPLYTAISFE
eukprot:NODE_93_length_21530_cov_0.700387.p16 type:complete len:138 gc:universal NODE_93_length_21530_cov_0.700387:20478-20065(-)